MFSPLAFLRTILHHFGFLGIRWIRIACVSKGRGSRIYSDVFIKSPRNISLGENVFVNQGCLLWAGPTSKIRLADDVLFGPRVTLIASNHGLQRSGLIRENPWEDADITVERDVWLGAGSTILAGITVGEGAVVAAGAVVTKNVAPYSIVGGVPAKVIGQRT